MNPFSSVPKTAAIHPDTKIGAVHLTVSSLDDSIAFYQRLGLQLQRREEVRAYLGVGGPHLLVLTENATARRVSGTAGLYHFALLVPSRPDLARTLRHLTEEEIPVQGFSDHGVSEAIYLSDPEGNGIEIYRDRPRSAWPRRDGRLQMTTEPLDVQNLLAEENATSAWEGLPGGTVMGHIHLHVADLTHTEAFYCDVLGFDRITRYGPRATFLSAGGYHHHIGANTWAGVGVPPAPDDALGLRYFTIILPDTSAWQQVVQRVMAAEMTQEEREDGLFLHDPAGNGVLLTSYGMTPQ